MASVALTAMGDVYAKYNTTASPSDFGYFNLRRHTGATTSILTTGVLPSVSSITGAIIIEGVTRTYSAKTLDEVITDMQANGALNTANVKS